MHLTFSQVATVFTYLSLLRSLPDNPIIPSNYLTAKLVKVPEDALVDQAMPSSIVHQNAAYLISYAATKPAIYFAFHIEKLIRERWQGSLSVPEKMLRSLQVVHGQYEQELEQFKPLIELMCSIYNATMYNSHEFLLKNILFSSSQMNRAVENSVATDEMTRKSLQNIFLVQETIANILSIPRLKMKLTINEERLEKGKKELEEAEKMLAKVTHTLEKQIHDLDRLMCCLAQLNLQKSSILSALEEEAKPYLLIPKTCLPPGKIV